MCARFTFFQPTNLAWGCETALAPELYDWSVMVLQELNSKDISCLTLLFVTQEHAELNQFYSCSPISVAFEADFSSFLLKAVSSQYEQSCPFLNR